VNAHYIRLLTPDYDPWAGYEWPDRSGQLERAPRKKKQDASA
jgi:ABC-type cobalt transport system substrate-binding protein